MQAPDPGRVPSQVALVAHRMSVEADSDPKGVPWWRTHCECGWLSDWRNCQYVAEDDFLDHVGVPCLTCHGEGWVEVVVPAHDPACDGSCLSCPVPVREQESCADCGGVGRVKP